MPRTVTSIACLLLAAAPLRAQDAGQPFKQEGKHEHGKVTLNLALEDDLLVAEIEAPAINVVGFERAPRSAAEKAAVAAAEAWLRSGASVLGVPRAAQCRLASAEVDPPTWTDGADHDHAHDHDHEHAGETHADYRASLRFRCANPQALAWLEPWALRRMRDVSEMTLNVVTPTVQASVTARRADERVALR